MARSTSSLTPRPPAPPGAGSAPARPAAADGEVKRVEGLHVLLAGGGSGGHVFPALAVASALSKRGGRATFVGSPHGFEARLVPERGIPFHALPAKPVLGRGPLDKARAGVTLLSSTWRARGLAKSLRPDAVLGTGGYASAAPVLGARLAGGPVVLLEPNADPGSANRALSRFAAGACVAFGEAGAGLRCRTWITGVPVREELFAIPAQLPAGELRLLVLGGSQGSRQLNELVPAAVGKLGLPLRVVHQCGKAHVDATRAAWQAAGVAVGPGERVEVLPFVDDVPGALAASHLVVSRAGAITLAEFCAAGRPSILVPLTIAAGHQQTNAEAMERAGAARVLAGVEATPEKLATLLSQLVSAGADLRTPYPTLQRMADAARALARPGAADAIVDRLAEVAR